MHFVFYKVYKVFETKGRYISYRIEAWPADIRVKDMVDTTDGILQRKDFSVEYHPFLYDEQEVSDMESSRKLCGYIMEAVCGWRM